MRKFVALLRGINVGGRVVKMDDLKKLLSELGFKNIKTYIQSGNVIFDSSETDPLTIWKNIENELHKFLGYEVVVFIKTVEELSLIVQNNPFAAPEKDMELYVTFLLQEPNKAQRESILELKDEVEDYKIIAGEIFILVKKHTYGKSKFSNNYLEKKMKISATTRNWNTLNRILALATS